MPGGEFECIFEACKNAGSLRGRWKTLYDRLTALAPDEHLENRELIWGLASGLWGLMDMANATSLQGDSDGLEHLRWVVASRCLKRMSGEFRTVHAIYTVAPSVSREEESLCRSPLSRYTGGGTSLRFD